MILTLSCTAVVLVAIAAASWAIQQRLDLQDSRAGRLAELARERMERIEGNVAYLAEIERKRMEVVGAAERAQESLEEEVAETLALANDRLGFRAGPTGA